MKTPNVYTAEWPFVRLLAPFAGGIYCAFVYPHLPQKIVAGFIAVLFICLITSCIFFSRWNLWQKKRPLSVFVLVFLLVSGMSLALMRLPENQPAHFSNIPGEKLIVTIREEPLVTKTTIRFVASARAVLRRKNLLPANGNLQVFIPINLAGQPAYRYGDELLLPVKFHTVQGPLNPAEFNYKKYLHNQQINHQIFLRQNETVLLAHDKGNPVIAFALALRQKMVAKLARHIHDHEALSVASTLLLGYRATLSDETLSAYSRTGTLHVLSVSGMHVALLYWLVAKLLAALGTKPAAKTLRILMCLVFIWAYALLTGFSPSVNRAALMLSLILLGKAFSRNNSSLNILAFSAFALLMYNPFYLADVGFQLSYLAVAGLIIIQPGLVRLYEPSFRPVYVLWQASSVSLSAQLATTPLSLFYFHQFPLYFLLSNLLIVLPSTVMMYCGLLFLIIPGDGFLVRYLGMLLEKTIIATNQVLLHIEHWPFAAIDRVWLNGPGLLLLSLLCASIACLIIGRSKKLVLPVLLLLLFFSAQRCIQKFREVPKVQLVLLSLSKHYAFIFQSGNQAYVFSNLKQNEKYFRYSVQPFLDSSSIRKCNINVNCGFASANKSLVQAGQSLILLYDSKFHRQKKHRPVKVDAVFVTENPYTDLQKIRRIASFRLLVIGNNNSARLTRKLSREAANGHIPCYVLRGHRALFVSINQ